MDAYDTRRPRTLPSCWRLRPPHARTRRRADSCALDRSLVGRWRLRRSLSWKLGGALPTGTPARERAQTMGTAVSSRCRPWRAAARLAAATRRRRRPRYGWRKRLAERAERALSKERSTVRGHERRRGGAGRSDAAGDGSIERRRTHRGGERGGGGGGDVVAVVASRSSTSLWCVARLPGWWHSRAEQNAAALIQRRYRSGERGAAPVRRSVTFDRDADGGGAGGGGAWLRRRSSMIESPPPPPVATSSCCCRRHDGSSSKSSEAEDVRPAPARAPPRSGCGEPAEPSPLVPTEKHEGGSRRSG